MAEAPRRRHDLFRVDPSAWSRVVAARADLVGLPWVADWAASGWPLIVRRPGCSDPALLVSLGLPLPPSAGKLRLSFAFPAEVLEAAELPPLMTQAAGAAPPAWRDTLDRLIALDPGVRVFGALAWQAMTGLAYLGPASDIDLIWALPSPAQVPWLLAEIGAIDAAAPMRLDGEVIRADGAAVNWRELAAGVEQVMVKRLADVSLQPRAAFLEGYA